MQFVPCLSAFLGVPSFLRLFYAMGVIVFRSLLSSTSPRSYFFRFSEPQTFCKGTVVPVHRNLGTYWPYSVALSFRAFGTLLCNELSHLPPRTYAALRHFTGTALETEVRLKTSSNVADEDSVGFHQGFPQWLLLHTYPATSAHNAQGCRCRALGYLARS